MTFPPVRMPYWFLFTMLARRWGKIQKPLLFQYLLPHMLRSQCGPANYKVYSSYTFRDQGSDRWVDQRTQWTHCESDLARVTILKLQFPGSQHRSCVQKSLISLHLPSSPGNGYPSKWPLVHLGKDKRNHYILAVALQSPLLWRPDLSLS